MKYLLSIALLSLVLFSGCSNIKNIHYLQDIDQYQMSFPEHFNERQIKVNDLLRIRVFGPDSETLDPFNTLLPQGVRADNLDSYLVENDGTITFPTIGKIHVLGYSTTELNDLLTKKLSEYIKEPHVTVRITNFKVTILGEVSRPGVYYISDERITLLEAIGKAGDLTLYGERDTVLLLRDDNGVKSHITIDIRSSDFLDSPYFYLMQNDVIYVKQNKQQTMTAVLRNTGIYFSIISLITSLYLFIRIL